MSLVVRELTPAGAGAVSVLELAGPDAHAHAERFLGRTLSRAEPALVRLAADGEFLDDVLVCACSAESVELQLHGSPPLVRRVIALLAERFGARVLGERDVRAGVPRDAHIDAARSSSLEARALAGVPEAASAAGARMLLDQARGALRAALVALPDATDAERARVCRELAERGRVAQFLLRPAVVVLAGPVNAGKSTLFNALLGRERAITSAEAGTTRDVLRERARLGEWPVEFVDTAGERATAADAHGAVERAGQALARGAAAHADVVLWLLPPDAEPPANSPAHWRVLGTHADRVPRSAAISALADPRGACARVRAIVGAALGWPEHAWTSGAAVPWELALATELAALAHETSARALRERLAPWLAAGRAIRSS